MNEQTKSHSETTPRRAGALGIDEHELARVWDLVFNLATQFLHNPDDAEEATQEIFLKAQESAGSFRGESSVGTWIYRIAKNHLIDRKRARFKERITFAAFEEDVNAYVPFENELRLSETEMTIYAKEIKVGCTKAMLQCLDPIDRFVYIVGKLFAFEGKEGAYICDMSETAYRQRLSRASRKIGNFMKLNCGLANENATCHCRKRIGIALERDRIRPELLQNHVETKAIREYRSSMERLDAVAETFRDNPYAQTAEFHTEEISRLIEQLASGSS